MSIRIRFKHFFTLKHFKNMYPKTKKKMANYKMKQLKNV